MNKKILMIIILILFVALSYLILSNKSSFYNKYESNTVDQNNDKKNEAMNENFSFVVKNTKDQDIGIALFSKNGEEIGFTLKLINVDNNIYEASLAQNDCISGKLIYNFGTFENSQLDTVINKSPNDFFRNQTIKLKIVDSENELLSCTDVGIK